MTISVAIESASTQVTYKWLTDPSTVREALKHGVHIVVTDTLSTKPILTSNQTAPETVENVSEPEAVKRTVSKHGAKQPTTPTTSPTPDGSPTKKDRRGTGSKGALYHQEREFGMSIRDIAEKHSDKYSNVAGAISYYRKTQGLPKVIAGRPTVNQKRDAKILKLADKGQTYKDIGKRFGLTGSRIEQIVYKERQKKQEASNADQ